MPGGQLNSPEAEINNSSETLFNPRSIAIVTGTFYPTWYEGQAKEPLSTDKIRGDLALENFKLAKKQNFQLSIVDGGSSDAFKKALQYNNIAFSMQRIKGGQGPARRQGIEEIASLPQIKVVCEMEPEKVSIVSDCMRLASLPILKGETDIVVPSRDAESFSTYPKFQAEQELKANKLYNDILRKHDLLKDKYPDLDFWFGVRFFANRPEINDLFKKVYHYRKDTTAIDKKINVDMYSNPILFPIVAALHQGLKVMSMPVPYKHPETQTHFEEGRLDFHRKRLTQRRTITVELVNFIRFLENSPKTRLS